jgi:hypothetical protein
MDIGRAVLLLLIGAAINEIIHLLSKKGDKRERRKNARTAIARHMQRVWQLIDGLGTYVVQGLTLPT